MKTPLKVAMIIQSYFPRVGGAERLLEATIPYLQAEGIEIHVMTRRYSGFAPYEIVKGAPVHRLPIPGPKPVRSLSYTLTALPLIHKLNPDIIHAHEILSPTTIAVLAKYMYGKPIVVTAHRGGAIGDVQRLKQKLFGNFRMALFRQVVDRFVIISKEIDNELAHEGVSANQRTLIPNAVDTQRFQPLSETERQNLRQKIGLPVNALIAIYAGRLVPEKRVNHLLAVWPHIRERYTNAQLYILGTGPEETQLRSIGGEGIHFLGRIENVVDYLQTTDLFILPSVAEGSSIALLEAMACGSSVLVTAVGGSPEVITHAENGWLIPPDDKTALQEAILHLFENEKLRKSMAEKARQHITTHYDLVNSAKLLADLYRELRQEKKDIL